MQGFRVLLLLLYLFPGVAFAQVYQFDLDGDFLSRGELRVGGNEAGSETAEGDFAAFILGRSRLSAHYRLLSDKRELHWGWLMFRFAPRLFQSRR